MGQLPNCSHRTLIALFADDLVATKPSSVQEVADRWATFFWKEYLSQYAAQIALARHMNALPPTPENKRTLSEFKSKYEIGFCVGGVCLPSRRPHAFEISYDLLDKKVVEIQTGSATFWGMPNIINRLIFGIDSKAFERISQSLFWKGTPNDLASLIAPSMLSQPKDAPLREAIDWVHASIYMTIKAVKFSQIPPACGGSIELAMVTSDRPFRWVRHKRFDTAIGDGVGHEV